MAWVAGQSHGFPGDRDCSGLPSMVARHSAGQGTSVIELVEHRFESAIAGPSESRMLPKLKIFSKSLVNE